MILRTPEERFANLPDYDFAPHYLEIGAARMHFVDEGARAADETVLMLHGEPSWSFLYRRMIPVVARAGHRALAPDLFGFGKSDKFTDAEKYTYQTHLDSLKSFLERLDLRQITLFCQDWGGLLGLRLAAEMPDRFARIIASNTFLPTGDEKITEGFLKWLHFSQSVEDLPIGKIIQGGTVSKLSGEIVAAYDAPFPDASYKTAAKKFPLLVPVSPDNSASEANRRAWKVLRQWDKPFLTVFGDSDPVTRGAEKILQAEIPGAKGQKHLILENSGHFIQEDKGEELAEIIVKFIADEK